MGRPLVTACMFCLLCATHAHCSSNHDTGNTLVKDIYNDEGGGGLLLKLYPSEGAGRRKRSEDFVKNVFEQFGDGETMSKAGFEKLLHSLGLAHNDSKTDQSSAHKHTHNSSNTHNKHCLTSTEGIIGSAEVVTRDVYRDLCPQLVHHMMSNCAHSGDLTHNNSDEHHHSSAVNDQTAVWVYASISVVMISLCGLLAVAVIPLMHHGLYQSLLQFLVALAVGTLCGDALLHLLPHAMMSSNADHHHGNDDSKKDQHEINLWRGLVASMAIVFFYATEKCLSIIAEWRKKMMRKNNMNMKVRVMRDDTGAKEGRVGEKLCKHKYSSYPYCYGEITNHADGHSGHGNTAEPEINSIATRDENGACNPTVPNHRHEENDATKEDIPSSEKQLLETSREGYHNDYTTIILREHETRHHGHAHTHGHVHSAPKSLGSVAWMVVLGDGIHNFTDGLAIGAAFAANIGGGVSTAVAVFCHELPHELGDFAVLLKAGMSAKQAVFYNLLSSVLCLFGMCLGVILGHSEGTTMWVFSAAAGMFLYIALVDMIPELTSSHATEGGSLFQGLLQVAGLLSGIAIMLLIALYEHDLKDAFKDTF